MRPGPRTTAARLAAAGCLLALLAGPGPAQISRDASFGTWPFLVGNMDGRISQVVGDALRNDLDTIYVSAFRATGLLTGTLWISDSAGTWSPAWGPVRPGNVGINLASLISAAHAQNLQVVAVVKCFAATAPPTSAAHRQYLLNVIDYLVNSYDALGRPVYDLDGIALDYVRFVGGSSNSPASVTQFVRDVKRRLGVLTLHAYLLASRWTLDGPVYDLNFNSYTSVINQNAKQYGQHWEQLARYVDVMMPMAYTADGKIYRTYAAHQAYVRTATRYVRTACQRAGFPSRRVVTAIRAYTDSNETATAQTIDASITGALAGGGNGYQAFRYGTIGNRADWWARLKAYAAPGPNRPLPSFTVWVAGLGFRLDATGSRDNDEPASGLRVRFDWENDGVFDTLPSTTKRLTWIARNPGVWRIGMEVRDSTGLNGYTTRRVRAPDALAITPGTLSASRGGTATLQLSAGLDTAGARYVLSGSLSGTAPGFPLAPGYVLPLNVDGVTVLLVQLGNSPLLTSSIGVLDGTGRARATFNPPAGLLLPFVNRTLHWAGAGLDVKGKLIFVTNAVPLRIGP